LAAGDVENEIGANDSGEADDRERTGNGPQQYTRLYLCVGGDKPTQHTKLSAETTVLVWTAEANWSTVSTMKAARAVMIAPLCARARKPKRRLRVRCDGRRTPVHP
jgi:hypothetical protein